MAWTRNAIPIQHRNAAGNTRVSFVAAFRSPRKPATRDLASRAGSEHWWRAPARQVDTGWRKKRVRKQEEWAQDL